MPVGSPGFVGSRLKEAREARQLTGLVLSEMSGVTASSISSYENGHASPSPEVLERMATVLGFKISFFFREGDPASALARQTVFERSKSSTTRATRIRARHQRTWLRENLQYLTKFIRLAPSNVPEPPQSFDWLDCTNQEIESIAKCARRAWNLGDGPISNATLLVENNGIITTLIAMNGDGLDAFSVWDAIDGRAYIALNASVGSAFRTRFNVCHELGHLILHKTLSPSEFEDRRYFKLVESQADRFASAFLAPAETFSPEITIPSLDMFRNLKSRWRVSVKMMIHRSQELSIIDREEARRLYINYNRRGWNKQEPLDEDNQIEEPQLVRQAYDFVMENSLIELSQIDADSPFNLEDVERIANLPIGYLDEDSPYNWAIRELNSGFNSQS